MKRLLVISTFLLLGACAQTPMDQEPLPQAPTTPVSTDPSPSNTAAVQDDRPRDAEVPSEPRRLRLAGVGSAPIVPLNLQGNALVPPADPMVLGWWGSKTNDRGTTLLVGHTVHAGGGFLDDLEKVPEGASLGVSGASYEVVSNRVISKAKLAQIAPKLFSQTGPDRLVVVTCEDYDPATGHYRSNVVLVAK